MHGHTEPLGDDRTEESLGGRHVAILAELGIDQVPVLIDSAIQVGPFARTFR